jgi:hypothetical protein
MHEEVYLGKGLYAIIYAGQKYYYFSEEQRNIAYEFISENFSA